MRGRRKGEGEEEGEQKDIEESEAGRAVCASCEQNTQ